MANPFVKGWRYLLALFGAKIDEYADPKVQIQQAIEEAQRQHQALVQQAAAVIGNQRQLEMRLSRQMSEVERLQGMARQALVLADRARANGDEAEAARYEQTAQTVATQLVAAEQAAEDLKTLHDQAINAATQARRAVDNNRMLLEQKLAERTKLLSQLEQAKMQESIARSLESMSALTAPADTPSLDEVRERIERRYATAMGRAELASTSVEGRMLELQKSTLDLAGASRLEQIRASMAGEKLGATPAAEPGGPGGGPGQRGPPRRDPRQPGPRQAGRRQHHGRLSRRRPGRETGEMADARTRHLRRLRSLRRAARRWSVLAAGLAGAAAVLTPYQGSVLPDAAWTAAAGGSVVLALWRWSDLRAFAARPVPPPPEPITAEQARARLVAAVERMPAGRLAVAEVRRHRARLALRGTAAAGPWSRLDQASATLDGLTPPD